MMGGFTGLNVHDSFNYSVRGKWWKLSGGAEDRVDFRGGGREGEGEGEGDKSSATEYKRGNIKIDR